MKDDVDDEVITLYHLGRAVMLLACVVVASIATVNLFADPLRVLARHHGHPVAQSALVDAAEEVQQAIERHNQIRDRYYWDEHDKAVDLELHKRLAAVVELQERLAGKLAVTPDVTPERNP